MTSPGTATVQGVDLARTSFDENELEKLSTANLNKPITMRVTDEERSPYGAVVLQPRESRIVRAECDGELAFVLFQAHTKYGANVTLSYIGDWSGPPPANASHRSRNAGLIRPCTNAAVKLTNEKFDQNLTVLLIAVGYSRVDPIPGGCALEFPLRISPFLRLQLASPTEISLEFQHARAGSLMQHPTSCSVSFSLLSYEIYLYYLTPSEDYHEALQLMSDSRRMPRHATRVHASETPRTRTLFVAYPQTRAIYSVLVRQLYRSGYETSAAYTPVATLGCADYPDLATCRTSTSSVVALALVTALALRMTLAGHRFLKTQITAASFLLFLLAFEPLLIPVAAVLASALGSLFFLGLWFFFGIPVLAVIPSGFLLGLLVAAFLSFTPLGNVLLLRSAFAFRTMTICSMLSITALLLPTTQLLSIVASSVVGSFCSLYAVDRVFLHSTFSNIVDVARARFEATTSIYTHNQVPFAMVDVVFILLWLVLLVAGVVIQYRDNLEIDREFPVAPIKLLKRYLRRQKGRLICTCVSRYDDDASLLMQDNADEFLPPGYSTFHGRNILI
ncbi:transmembrane 7 superfamily member 3-like isoform X2 [Varroa destructor]|uniref:TM7S3/TM198-like domain-containing protein n=1 Tax=Varroa destructor TaxID=109461 RepID=A0A7M7KHN2_VARDE|nr:transmembrane 7 superfamily member 3-like isoform X2 [Varroa destructor]XP_022666028.1 transmembrane 7 superfamily member 3-like isoform X2 [Varroa destructor]